MSSRQSNETSPSADTRPPWSGAIDVHHHIVPDFYREALASVGSAPVMPGVDQPHWDVDASLAMMRRQGIRAAVVNVWPGVPVIDEAPAAKLARRVNEFLAGLVADHPDRFGAFAVLPLPHVDAALSELEYALDVLGLDGIGLVTNYDGTYVGDGRFDPLLAELARRHVATFVHPTMSPATGQPTFGLPGSLYEFPFDTTRMVAQFLYNQTLERHPELRLILCHGGGAVPYLAERLTLGPVIGGHLAERLDTDPIGSLRRLYYDVAMSANPYTLPSLQALAPSSRILLGTDFPFMPEWSSAQNSRLLIERGGFAEDELARIARLNAAELFPRLA